MARSLIVSRYLAGRSIAEIVDGPIKAATRAIGELWRHSDQGIFYEHRASDILLQTLNQLRSLLADPPPGAAVAVGCAPCGDPYLLPTLAVALVLHDAGVAATNLGPDTPSSVLSLAVDSLGASIGWVSVSSRRVDGEALGPSLIELAERLGQRDGALIVGGRHADDLELGHRALFVGRSMADLAAFVPAVRASRQTRG